MSKNKIDHMGFCHICGEYRKLTFEHVPPKVALNNGRTIEYSTEEILKSLSDSNRLPWDRNGIKYKINQKGLGGYTLCDRCNNITGSYYGEEYAKWVFTFMDFIFKNHDEYLKGNYVKIKLGKLFPGRFIRQLLSIITSNFPTFTQEYPYVKELILDKNYNYLDEPGFKIYMYLLKYPFYYLSGPMYVVYENRTKRVDEIDVFPFGFIISFSNEKEKELDITNFINYGYNDQADVELIINIHEKNTIYPLDYRTQEDIKNMIEEIN